MLVLARHEGERILIGNDIIIEIVDIKPGRVSLGFTAPPEIKIDREEYRTIRDRETHAGSCPPQG